jgi:hypothetical protein
MKKPENKNKGKNITDDSYMANPGSLKITPYKIPNESPTKLIATFTKRYIRILSS